jgi:hypothetical protein
VFILLISNPFIYAVGDYSEPSRASVGSPRITASLGEIVTGVGSTGGDMFGWNASAMDDLNGDGLRELAVGAPGNDDQAANAGAVYIYYSYPGMQLNDLDVASANVSIYGDTAGAQFGWDLSALGDMDDDGLVELLVGAPGYNRSMGKIYIVTSTDILAAGNPGSIVIDDSMITLIGEDQGDRFGHSVAWLGNVTDGPYSDDFIVGAPFAGTNMTPIIIDDLDPGYHEVGNWMTWSGASTYYNQDVRFPTTVSGAGANMSFWTPNLPGGCFEVYVWWESWPGYAPDAPYTVNFKPGGYYWLPGVGNHITGIDTANASLGWVTIDVDQSVPSFEAQWNYLGTYEFESGTAGNVSLSDNVTDPTDLVAADAVRFVDASSFYNEGKVYVYDGGRPKLRYPFGVTIGENPNDFYGSSVRAAGLVADQIPDLLNDAIVSAPGANRAYVWKEAAFPTLYVDLSELDEDYPLPVDFTSGVSNASNTFGIGGAQDGWDWQKGTYGTLNDAAAQAACGWSADPGVGNTALDSDPALRIQIGGAGLSGQATTEGNGGNNFESAAWGIEFNLPQKFYQLLLNAGYKAYLSFEYAATDPVGTGQTEEEVIVYARFDSNYLGSNQGGDSRPEVKYYPGNFYNTEDTSFNFFEEDITGFIIGGGPHYIDFGVAINSWSAGQEGVDAYFDNVMLEFRKPADFDVILNGLDNIGFAFDVDGIGDVNGDGNDRDVIIGAPGSVNGNAYVFYSPSAYPAGTMLNVSDMDMDINISGSAAGDMLGWSVGYAGDIDNDKFDDILIGAPGFDGAAGTDSGVVYVYRTNDSMPLNLTGSDASNMKEGETAMDMFGYTVAGFNDINGDSYTDLFVGTPYFGTGDEGKIYIIGRLAPKLTITYPTASEILSGIVTITASVIDSNNDIDTKGVGFYYSTDQMNWYLIDSAATPSSDQVYEVTWDTSTLDDGSTYYIKANVTDLELNYAQDITAAFTLDNIFPPSINFIYPQMDDIVNGTITINASAVDSSQDLIGGGINNTKGMEFFYSEDGITWHLIGVDTVPDGTGIYNITWSTIGFVDGQFWLKVNVTDLDGFSVEDMIRIYIDNPTVEPMCNLLHPNATVMEVNGTLTVSAIAFDRDNDINSSGVSFYYSEDDTKWTFIDNDPTPDLFLVYETTWDTTTVADGWYSIKALVTDNTSLSNSSVSNQFLVHNSQLNWPQVNVTKPKKGELVKLNAKLEAEAYDLDGNINSEGISFYYSSDKINWIFIDKTNIPSSGRTSFTAIWDTTTVDDGRYWVNASATDTTNLTGWDISDEFFVHNAQLNPPIVDVLYPNGGEILTGTTALSASVGDLENNLKEDGISFYYSQDKIQWTLIGNVSLTPASGSTVVFQTLNLDWDTTTVDDGEYWLKATATDNHNLEGEDISDGPFYIHNEDANAPIVRVVYPNGGEVLKGMVTVQIFGLDLEDNINTDGIQVFYSTDTSSWTLAGKVPSETDPLTHIYELEWNTTTVPDGVYWLRATATDLTALEGSDISDDSFIIHNNLDNPPSVKIIYPKQGSTIQGTVTIQVEVDDLEDNVVEIQFYYSNDNTTWTLIGTSTSPTEAGGNMYTVPWSSNDVYDGIYYLRIVAVDNSSLETEAFSGGLNVDNGKVKPKDEEAEDLMAEFWWIWILIIIIIIVLCILLVVWSRKQKKEKGEPELEAEPSPDEARAVLREIGTGVEPEPPARITPIPAGAPRPKMRKVKATPQTLLTGFEGDRAAKIGDDIQIKLNEWRLEGFYVSRIEHLLETNADSLFLEFATFKANVAKLRELKPRFTALDTIGFEKEDRSIREKINNPDLADAVEKEIIELEIKIEKKDELQKLEAEGEGEDIEEGLLPPEPGEDVSLPPEEEVEAEEEDLTALLPEEPEIEEEEPPVEIEEESVDEDLEAADEEFDEEIEAADEEFEEELGTEEIEEGEEEEAGDEEQDMEEFLPDSTDKEESEDKD